MGNDDFVDAILDTIKGIKKPILIAIITSVSALGGLVGKVYSSANDRWHENEKATSAIDRRLGIVEDRGSENGRVLERLEQKLDFWILEDYRQHHGQPTFNPDPKPWPDALPRRTPMSGNRSNP